MKTIFLSIKDHHDRMAILEALQANGYEATVVAKTEYDPVRYVVSVEVEDYEVEE